MFHTAKEASVLNKIMTWSFGRDSFLIRIVEWKALQERYTPFPISQAMPKDSHAFLGRTNPTGDFRLFS